MTTPPPAMADLVDGSESPQPADKIANHGGGEKGPNGFFRDSSAAGDGIKIRPPSPPPPTSDSSGEDVIDDDPSPSYSAEDNNNNNNHHHATRATGEHQHSPPPSIHPSASVGLSPSSSIIINGRGCQNLPLGIEDHEHQHSYPTCDQPSSNGHGDNNNSTFPPEHTTQLQHYLIHDRLKTPTQNHRHHGNHHKHSHPSSFACGDNHLNDGYGDNYELSPSEQRQKCHPPLITPSHHDAQDKDTTTSPSPHHPAMMLSIHIGQSVRIIGDYENKAKIRILQYLIDNIKAEPTTLSDDCSMIDEDPLADSMGSIMDEIVKREMVIASKVDKVLTDGIAELMGMFTKVQIAEEKAVATTQPQDCPPLSNADAVVNDSNLVLATPSISEDNMIDPSVDEKMESDESAGGKNDEEDDVFLGGGSCDEESTTCSSGKKRKRDDVNTDDGDQQLLVKLEVPPGPLRLSVSIVKGLSGAKIARMNADCTLDVAVGDRIVTVDDQIVNELADLTKNTDKIRIFGIAKKLPTISGQADLQQRIKTHLIASGGGCDESSYFQFVQHSYHVSAKEFARLLRVANSKSFANAVRWERNRIEAEIAGLPTISGQADLRDRIQEFLSDPKNEDLLESLGGGDGYAAVLKLGGMEVASLLRVANSKSLANAVRKERNRIEAELSGLPIISGQADLEDRIQEFLSDPNNEDLLESLGFGDGYAAVLELGGKEVARLLRVAYSSSLADALTEQRKKFNSKLCGNLCLIELQELGHKLYERLNRLTTIDGNTATKPIPVSTSVEDGLRLLTIGLGRNSPDTLSKNLDSQQLKHCMGTEYMANKLDGIASVDCLNAFLVGEGISRHKGFHSCPAFHSLVSVVKKYCHLYDVIFCSFNDVMRIAEKEEDVEAVKKTLQDELRRYCPGSKCQLFVVTLCEFAMEATSVAACNGKCANGLREIGAKYSHVNAGRKALSCSEESATIQETIDSTRQTLYEEVKESGVLPAYIVRAVKRGREMKAVPAQLDSLLLSLVQQLRTARGEGLEYPGELLQNVGGKYIQAAKRLTDCPPEHHDLVLQRTSPDDEEGEQRFSIDEVSVFQAVSNDCAIKAVHGNNNSRDVIILQDTGVSRTTIRRESSSIALATISHGGTENLLMTTLNRLYGDYDANRLALEICRQTNTAPLFSQNYGQAPSDFFQLNEGKEPTGLDTALYLAQCDHERICLRAALLVERTRSIRDIPLTALNSCTAFKRFTDEDKHNISEVMRIIGRHHTRAFLESKRGDNEPVAEETNVDYSTMTVTELKEILRSKGLKLGGKKDDLIKRLEESLSPCVGGDKCD